MKKYNNEYREMINLLVNMMWFYFSKEELEFLTINKEVELNNKKLFLSTSKDYLTVIWAVYAVIAAIFKEKTYFYFEYTIFCLSIITILIFVWSLYQKEVIKKLDMEIMSIKYILRNYDKYHQNYHK